MNQSHDNLEQLLARIASGDLDGLSASDIATVEHALHANPALADRFADAMPPANALLQVPVAKPSAAEWSGIWSEIERRRAMPMQDKRRREPRVFTLWRAWAAVAACVGLFALWRVLPISGNGAGGGDDVRLASGGNVEILDMEVFGGRSATLHFADDGSGAVIISISDPENEDSGAS